MKRQMMIWILIVSVMFMAFAPVCTEAKELYGFSKEPINAYKNSIASSSAGKIRTYRGFKVLKKKGSYYYVQYSEGGKTRKVWISKKDLAELCLKYDGSEIPLVADGIYDLGGESVHMIFLGNGKYRIQMKENGTYLSGSADGNKGTVSFVSSAKDKSTIWKCKRNKFNLLIQNVETGLYLTPYHSIFRLAKYEDVNDQNILLIRKDNNVSKYRDFVQYDGRWGRKKYGKSTRMAQAACGLLAITNAVYAANGQFVDPMDLAEFACDNGYRIENYGTDEGIFKAFAKTHGEKFGIAYSGKVENVYEITDGLQKGKIFIAHVPGHYLCVIDQKKVKNTRKYLLLDSHPLPKRGTSPFGSWMSEKRLGMDSLSISNAFVYNRIKQSDFQWDLKVQKTDVMQDLAKEHAPGGWRGFIQYWVDKMKGI